MRPQRDMNPQTRRSLLTKEGARPSRYDLKELKQGKDVARPERRKYRKLRRKAAEQGVSLETLLIRREADRDWDLFHKNIGAVIYPYREGVTYACEIISCGSVKISSWRRKPGTDTDEEVFQTRRGVTLRVLGYLNIHETLYPPPDYKHARLLPVGAEWTRTTKDLQKAAGRLSTMVDPAWAGLIPVPKPLTLAGVVQAKIDHAEKCAAGDQKRGLKAPDSHTDGFSLFTKKFYAESHQDWLKVAARWRDWLAKVST